MKRDDDAPLDDATLRALRESDDLVPTSEAEVERAEAALQGELPLPERLRSYRPPRALLAAKGAARKPSLVGYVAVAGIGALAAAALLSWLRPATPPALTNAGGELVRPSRSAAAPLVPLAFSSRCERECCAGRDCKAASPTLSACPSGMRCIGCAADNVNGGPYRLRVGTVIVSDAGQKALPRDAALNLCVVSANETLCLPAFGEPGASAWRSLGAVTPLQDLLAGIGFELRKRGEATQLAGWKHAVPPTPDVMCKGLAVQLADGTDTLARLSAFVEPTHFVELSRAEAVPELLQTLRRFEVSGTEPRIYESSRAGAGRFALVLGPFERSEADALRWQALDHGVEAEVTHGLDFIGSPRPTP